MLNFKLTAAEIASKCPSEIIGDPQVTVSNINTLEKAKKHELSFFALSTLDRGKKLQSFAENSQAGIILTTEPIKFDLTNPIFKDFTPTQIVTAKPFHIILFLIESFYQPPRFGEGIDSTARIDTSAKISDGVSIDAYSVIGKNVLIGENTKIFPHVTIYENAQIGKNCVIHAGAIIREGTIIGDNCVIQNGVVVGGDGFGFIPDPNVGHRKIPHIGQAIIGNYIEIGANSTIDRATLGETNIADYTKIDNLVMIGHNVSVGEKSLLCAQVGIAGSTRVGKEVIFGGQAGIADHLEIGDKVKLAAKTGVTGSISAEQTFGGYPAQEIHEWRRSMVTLRRLAKKPT